MLNDLHNRKVSFFKLLIALLCVANEVQAQSQTIPVWRITFDRSELACAKPGDCLRPTREIAYQDAMSKAAAWCADTIVIESTQTTPDKTFLRCETKGWVVFQLDNFQVGKCPVGEANNLWCEQKKSHGPQCNGEMTPLPVHMGTGNKFFSEIDYDYVGIGGLKLQRSYNSQNSATLGMFGAARLTKYDRSITGLWNGASSAAIVTRADGNAYGFSDSGTSLSWKNPWNPVDDDIKDSLIRKYDASSQTIGWDYKVAADNSVESYDPDGKLISITDRNGLVQTLTYSTNSTPVEIAPSAGLLLSVTDYLGRQLGFTYNEAGLVKKMVDVNGDQYFYLYDSNKNLVSLTYPDAKIKTYLYNETAFTGGANLPNALTGIVDEKNVRFASYFYNANGKVIAEQLAGGVSQYQLSFSVDDSNTVVTDPLGTTRTVNFTKVLGALKSTGQSQPAGAGCSAASSTVTYDANGNVASRTDFNNYKTCYAYDTSRNLETARVEGLASTDNCATALAATSLTLPVRKISTAWHTTYRLPVTIAEPKRITVFSHDTNGNVLTKTLKATSDTTGVQGTGATQVGTSRIWTTTYNSYGQVLTATGPRTDVLDKTTYAYDATTGNLLTVTNAAGHITTLGNYDANGRVGQITDPNGLVTDLTYYPRGWLKTRTITGTNINELTQYEYDGVGQLKKVTLPDNSWIGYDYDNAHRLTDIYDSQSNRISYVLDAMGNRTSEQIKDPSGALKRQISREYDALNRLKTVTGANQ